MARTIVAACALFRVVVMAVCVGAFYVQGAAVRLRGTNEEAGEAVGQLILEADRASKAEVGRDGPSAPGAYYGALAKTLRDGEEALVNPHVSEVVERANSLAERKGATDFLCPRKWAELCPEGWAALAARTCVAPPSYQGPCKRTQILAGAAVWEKRFIADNCKAPWPCAGWADGCTDGRNYDECPAGWADAGAGLCKASSSNATSLPRCPAVLKLGDLQIADKQELAVACGLRWPCRRRCWQDFRLGCPAVAWEGTCEGGLRTRICCARNG